VYLLDTDALSLTSPRARHSADELDRWRVFIRVNVDALHLSVVSLMEVRLGINLLASRGATRQAKELEKWALLVETIYTTRLLLVSAPVARRAGTMLARAIAGGYAPAAEDAFVAATAAEHGLRLISRNRKDMDALGVDCLDPLSELPN
jgi:predicted nucleic acid-binding protein